MTRPWFAIVWFAVWGLFQAFAVGSILAGTWKKPEAFPDSEAYRSLIYADMVFIPLYLLTSALLLGGYRAGPVLGIFAGGAIVYVMIYLIALSGFRGAMNLVADGTFLICTVLAMWQLSKRLLS
jgi:hypothetical protein